MEITKKFTFTFSLKISNREKFHDVIIVSFNKEKILDEINAYKKIKKHLKDFYSGIIDFQLIYDFVKNPILAWSLEERVLEPVKDYIEDCRNFTKELLPEAYHNFYVEDIAKVTVREEYIEVKESELIY